MEDDVEAYDIDEDTAYAEESNNSKSADSDFEIEEDPDSAGGSTEDSAIQYSRPVTRRTVKRKKAQQNLKVLLLDQRCLRRPKRTKRKRKMIL